MVHFRNKRNLILGLEGNNRSLDKGGQVVFQTLSFTQTFEGNGLVVATSDLVPPDINPNTDEGQAGIRGIAQRIENARAQGTHFVILVRSPSLVPGSIAASLLPAHAELAEDPSNAGITADVPELAALARVYGRTNVTFNITGGTPRRISVRMASEVDTTICKGFADTEFPGTAYFLPLFPLPQDTDRFVLELLPAIEADLSALLSPSKHPITDDFRFSSEEALASERDELLERISNLEESLASYQARKSILFLRDQALQEELPPWIERNLGISTEEIDGKHEDFWLVSGEQRDRIAIGEIKGLSGNVRKQHVTMLIQHRQENELPEDFLSLLVVNSYASAPTVREKDRERVSPDVVRWAHKNHVLIIRTMDLVRLADLIEQHDMTAEQLLSRLQESTGWLRVSDAGETTALQK